MYYERGIWYEMRDRGIYLWWGWIAIIALSLGAIMLYAAKYTGDSISTIALAIGVFWLSSLALITAVYALTAWACQLTTGRELQRIEQRLGQTV